MPVYKYKTFEEARKVLWNFNPDKEYYRQVADLFDSAFLISTPKCRTGIQFFKSIEDAAEARLRDSKSQLYL